MLVADILAFFTMGLLVYLGYHAAAEKDEGKYIPFFWERKPSTKLFDKSHVQYRDGDNT